MDLTPVELLRMLGQRGILTLPEGRGGITTLLCDMDVCYCPHGRGYFDLKTHPPKAWDPSVDHDPDLKMDGGQRILGNVRLAHILCNNLAFGDGPGHEKKRRKAAAEQVQWHRDHPEESLRNAGNRAAAQAQWEMLRGAAEAAQATGSPEQ
jgi:hypothetical protein